MHISRPAWIPVAVSIGGAIVGVVVSRAIPPMYASSSQVRVQVPGEGAQRIRTAIEAAVQEAALDKGLITVRLRDEPGGDTVLLEVSGSADSALSAKQATENALRSIVHASLGAAERREPNLRGDFRVIAPANLPDTPQRDTARLSVVGGGLGLVGGVVVAFVARRRRREAA